MGNKTFRKIDGTKQTKKKQMDRIEQNGPSMAFLFSQVPEDYYSLRLFKSGCSARPNWSYLTLNCS